MSAEVDTQWFRQRLADRELSMRKLAKILHVDVAAVSLMLRGRRGMRLEEATTIAEVLHVPLSQVLTHAGVRVRPRIIG